MQKLFKKNVLIKLLTPLRGNSDGFILVTAMWIMVILVLIGLASVRSTSIELLIAANDKFHKMAFYNADGGVSTAPKLIGRAINAGIDPVEANLTLFAVDGAISGAVAGQPTFYDEIMGFVEDADPAALTTPELSYTIDSDIMTVNIDHDGARILVGGGAEFASGAAGPGSGSAGGVEIRYILTSSATSLKNSQSDISARYRKIPGTAGGM